jgi:hypothetical protein
MATKAQLEAARTNIKKAQAASREKRTLVHMSEGVRRASGKRVPLAGSRPSESGRALEDRNSQQLYALASEHRIEGRSKMGKSELISAIRKVAEVNRPAQRAIPR